MQNFKSLLSLGKCVGGKETKLYVDDSCPNQLNSQSSPGGLDGTAGVEGQRDGKFREGKLYCVCYACRVSVAACNVCVDVCTCTCGCKCKCNNVHSCMDTCIYICVALPIVVGVWPMAGTLWLLFEY